MAIADRHGLPYAVHVACASPHETKLVEATLNNTLLDQAPKVLIGDKAYDSDGLDERLLEEHGVTLIAPHKVNCIKKRTQNGRALRRYKRRWKVERLFAWLQNFRRLVVRYERHLVNFSAMVQLGCIIILLRQF